MADQYRRLPEWAPMMLDENLQDGVHYAERRKLRAVTQPLLAPFRGIPERGSAHGLFAANAEVYKFYAAAFSRSEEQRVGKECVCTWRTQWSLGHKKKKKE